MKGEGLRIQLCCLGFRIQGTGCMSQCRALVFRV